MKVATPEAYRLMHEGAIALAQIEANGMRMDVPYLDHAIAAVGAEIKQRVDALRTTSEYSTWRRRYGTGTNLGSRDQLAQILYGDLGLPGGVRTRSGKRFAVDEGALARAGLPFVRELLGIEGLKKLRSTYLVGFRKRLVDGLLHPFFNLHNVITYRGSSDSPNFQNIPIRDPILGKWIRTAFIPRPGHVLLEIDLKANEVRVATCYHRDPTMIRHIQEGFDFHAGMAASCYMLDGKIPKQARNVAKGSFVFAEFYGSDYIRVAPALWDAADGDKLTTADGVGMREHLAARGITQLGDCNRKLTPIVGTYEHHIRAVERVFWDEWYPGYRDWKEVWWQDYLRRGGYQMKTGFVVQGVYKKNEVINGPIQGAAFHCLLWFLIEMQKWLRKNRMRSMIIGQIHDSGEFDVHRDELDVVVNKAMELLRVDIRRAWPWLVVPLEGEAEVGEANWWEKKPYHVAA